MTRHVKGCAALKGDRSAECTCGSDTDIWSECAHCQSLTLCDDLRNHGEDCDLCPKCSDEFEATVRACHHWYNPEPIWNEYGEEGRICQHCGCFVDNDLAMHWAPFICDGFVDVEIQ